MSRRFLSGESDDWEPSLAVGRDRDVHVIAGRLIPAPSGSTQAIGDSRIVTWSSSDGGTTFAPATEFARGGGDERIKADTNGTIFASWIRVESDSTGKRVDINKGGLVLATSRDRGHTWNETIVATLASGVADKPELAVSRDGRDLYIAFMARGTLDVVSSHDGGSTWARRTADSTLTGHWPSGITLTPNGHLFVVDARQVGSPADTVLRVDLQLVQSTDGGNTWRRSTFSTSSRVQAIGTCLHGTSCPVQIPYPTIATDALGRLYVAYTEGLARQRYSLHFMRSDDGGTSWTTPNDLPSAARVVSGDSADVYYPMIAAGHDGLVYLAWFDDRAGPLHVWGKRSADGGRTWGPDVRLSHAQGLAGIYGEYGGIAIDDRGVLHVAWSDGTGHVGSPGAKGGTWYARWDGRVPR